MGEELRKENEKERTCVPNGAVTSTNNGSDQSPDSLGDPG